MDAEDEQIFSPDPFLLASEVGCYPKWPTDPLNWQLAKLSQGFRDWLEQNMRKVLPVVQSRDYCGGRCANFSCDWHQAQSR